jgi:hypothetical protein
VKFKVILPPEKDDDLDFPVVAVRDAELDVEELMRRIRTNMARREKLPPLAAALGKVRLFEERNKLLEMLSDLQRAMSRYGIVEEVRTGWKGTVLRSIKRVVRKACGLFIAQQQAVHEQLQRTFTQFAQYLDAQQQVVSARFDQSDRSLVETANNLRALQAERDSESKQRTSKAA